MSSLRSCKACCLAINCVLSALPGRGMGDGGPGHSLGRGDVNPPVWRDGDGDVLLQSSVLGGLICGVVLPAAPDDGTPRTAQGTQRTGVIVTTSTRSGVVVLGPGMPVAGAVGQSAERGA